MQRALLERSQFIDVMAETTQGGRAMHLLSSLSRGMHAEAAVQARERHLLHGHAWPHARRHRGAHMASHVDVHHGSVRPTHERTWLVCFVCRV